VGPGDSRLVGELVAAVNRVNYNQVRCRASWALPSPPPSFLSKQVWGPAEGMGMWMCPSPRL
jgi:hypothetical protein